MYNLASKLLAPWFDPMALALVLAVCGLVCWKRRRLALRLLIVSAALLAIFSASVVAGGLVHSLEDQYPDRGLDVPPAQAIIVLGGTIHMPFGRHSQSGLIESSDRLLMAFRLYRAGRAPLIFCSGGNNPLGGRTANTPEATWMTGLLVEWGVPPSAIQEEGGSINTRENALVTFQSMAPRGIRRIILVTSAMHMPRAAGSFRKAGFDVIAAPADFHTGWGEPNAISRWIPSTHNLLESETAMHEWLGVLVYRLRGWE